MPLPARVGVRTPGRCTVCGHPVVREDRVPTDGAQVLVRRGHGRTVPARSSRTGWVVRRRCCPSYGPDAVGRRCRCRRTVSRGGRSVLAPDDVPVGGGPVRAGRSVGRRRDAGPRTAEAPTARHGPSRFGSCGGPGTDVRGHGSSSFFSARPRFPVRPGPVGSGRLSCDSGLSVSGPPRRLGETRPQPAGRRTRTDRPVCGAVREATR
jgi:hypothetical protein